MPEWDGEIEVDADRARSLVASTFPELAGLAIAPIGVGWDNAVFAVGSEWVFRFPRRAIAVPGVEREIQVLPRLAGHVPSPISVPRWLGAPTESYPWPWWGGRLIAGIELAESSLPDAGRGALGAQLGTFLRALHGPGLMRTVGASLPLDPMRRGDLAVRVPYARRRLDQVTTAGLWQTTPEVERLLADAAEVPPPSRTTVLHGDLHSRHVLVDHAGGLTGVIDWGDVCAGDPAVDLSIVYAALVGEARSAFFDAYGPIDALTELRARVLAVFLAATLLLYAADVGFGGLGKESRRSLERAVT